MKESQTDKLLRLIRKAGIDSIDFERKYVAIKIHFGEMGNLAFLRHNYAAKLVEHIKSRGGRPFVTDCNTLYVGSRTNALDHLDCAYKNGYNPLTLGCHTIIADGLKGTDETLVDIDGEYVKQAKIGSAIMDADIIISLSHFKGHDQTGFGGAVKNLGMGCGSRAGKMEMHCSSKTVVDPRLCVGCGRCKLSCAHGAITLTNKKASIDVDKCVGCGRCIGACNANAIEPENYDSNERLGRRMAEYAFAVVKDRPNFHICLALDISPLCDCYSKNDISIIPDVGMFASFDPVALDHACADACNAMPVREGSMLEHSHEKCAEDHFTALAHDTNWRDCLAHCEKIGVGNFDYELEKL